MVQANRKDRKAGITAIQNTARMSSANSSISPTAASGARKRADRVERLAQAIGRAAQLRRRFVGDHRVARGAADALADPVDKAGAEHRQRALGQREQRLGQRGQAIAEQDPWLAPLLRSLSRPDTSLAMLAVPSAMPSIAPIATTGRPSVTVRKAGSSA